MYILLVARFDMIRGVGIDMVYVPELQRLMETFPEPVIRRIFSEDEIEASKRSARPVVSLAGRFGVKEAVFKAIAHLTKRKGFDMRVVESLNRPDGYPYVKVNDKLRKLMDEAGVDDIFISITTERDYVTVVAVAEGR